MTTPMPQTTIVRATHGLFVHDFTTGAKPAKLKPNKTERDILALALWLEQTGNVDEADRVIECYCSTKRSP